MPKSLRVAILFILPLALALAAVEWQLREVEKNSWFQGLANYCATKQMDFLFVGTSTTATAVDSDQFAKDLGRAWVRSSPGCSGNAHPVALNVGAGYSTPAEYYFGLKHLIQRDANALKCATVFIEAPGGIPASDTWQGPWLNLKRPRLLVQNLDFDQLLRFLREFDCTPAQKAVVVLSYLSTTYAEAPTLRHGIMESLDRFLDHVFPQAPGHYKPAAILERGGVQVDEVAMSVVRAQVISDSAAQLKAQQAIKWDSTIMHDIVDLVQAHGGTVVFFDLPVSSYLRAPLATDVRRADREGFLQAAIGWNCRYLQPQCAPFTDVDFPDLLHMARWRTPEFTQALALSYLQNRELNVEPAPALPGAEHK